MGYKNKKIVKWQFLFFALFLAIFIFAQAATSEAEEKKETVSEMAPALRIPQPQFFCGSCHILSYPSLIKKQYELWKKSKHNDVGCVSCHYGPDESKPVQDAKDSHIFPQPPLNFSHIKLGGEIMQTRAKIEDATCMTAQCHGKPDDKFKTKKIQFTEKVVFVHEPHFEEKNQIKGQKIGCTNCHQHETDLKKIEVSKSSCYLCHFMGTKFNDERGRCELCHKLPEEPIKPPTSETYDTWGEESGDGWDSGFGDGDDSGFGGGGDSGFGDAKDSGFGDAEDSGFGDTGDSGFGELSESGFGDAQKSNSNDDLETVKEDLAAEPAESEPGETRPITHAMLKEAGVSCFSCHFDLVQASTSATYAAFFEKGVLKTAVVYGVGQIKKDSCLACHDKEKDLKEAMTMELMHERHVTDKTARCLDCHQEIKHVKSDLEERMPQDDDPVLLNGCTTCHPEPHFYQRVLTSGFKNPAFDPVPDPMYSTKVNCLGCHNEQSVLPEGHTVLKGSEKMCVSCHDKEYEKTFKEWKKELEDKIKAVSQLEKEIIKGLNNAKAGMQEDQLIEIMSYLKEAQEDLKIVQFGNGVHNKKYALQLLDESAEKFKELEGMIADISN